VHSSPRRTFLKGSLAATGLTIAVSVSPLGYRLVNASQGKEALKGFKPNLWYEITRTISLPSTWVFPRWARGTHTALAMVIADELEADWKQIRVKQGPASKEYINPHPYLQLQITVQSAGVRMFYEPLRKAAAAGRAMLVKAAATSWNVPENECEASKGTVTHKKTLAKSTYGQLCLDAAKLKVPQNPPLKDPKDFRFIGKPMARVEGLPK